MLGLLDGLAGRGLLGRAAVVTVGACRLELNAETPDPEITTKQRELEEKRLQREADELAYGSS